MDFFFNEQYISKLFNSKRTNFLDVLMDSIESLIYTTIFGGLISFIIGFVFGTDKKIDSVMEANNKNKILLRGQLSKVYKLNNLILVIFIIFQFIIMAFFTMYIFCFCYVYPNSILEWCKTSLFVIGLIQSISFLTSALISTIRYVSVKCRCESCFNFNSYLEDYF